MPDTSLGFSDTGSPVPWHYAFASENRTETRPDAPSNPARRPSSLPRPPSIQTPVTAETAPTVLILGFRSAFSRESPPFRRKASFHLFELNPFSRIHSTRHPAARSTASRFPTQNQKSRVRWVPASALTKRLQSLQNSPKGVQFNCICFSKRSTRRSVSRKPKLPRSTWPKPESLQTPNHRSRRTQRTEVLPVATATNRIILVFSRQRTCRKTCASR
jgi:hypothetical protein